MIDWLIGWSSSVINFIQFARPKPLSHSLTARYRLHWASFRYRVFVGRYRLAADGIEARYCRGRCCRAVLDKCPLHGTIGSDVTRRSSRWRRWGPWLRDAAAKDPVTRRKTRSTDGSACWNSTSALWSTCAPSCTDLRPPIVYAKLNNIANEK